VRLPRVSPLLGTALGTGLVCFMLIFVGAVVNRPPVALMLGAFLTLRVFAQVLFSFLRRQVNSGKKDLVIDFFAETLTLPQSFGRTSAFTIPLDDVTIDVIEVYINQGRWYAPVVRWTDATGGL